MQSTLAGAVPLHRPKGKAMPKLLLALLCCLSLHAADYEIRATDGTRVATSHGWNYDRHTLVCTLHGARGAVEVRLRHSDKWVKATVVKTSEYLDAAMLHVDAELEKPEGTSLATIGEAETAGKPGAIEGVGNLKLKGPVSKGDSGSAVMQGGKVVGMLLGDVVNAPERAFYVDVASLVKLVEEK